MISLHEIQYLELFMVLLFMDTIDWEIFSHVIWLSYVYEHTCQQDLQNNNLLFILIISRNGAVVGPLASH